MNQRKLYAFMTIGGGMGLVSAFLQTLEKISLLKHPKVALTCDLNSVFSCTNVLNAWQSSVFGFPNSIMCMILFTTFTVAGVAELAASRLSRGFRLGVQGLSLFTLGFALWFLQQSTFAIRSLCIFCLVCFAGLLFINWAWLRINAADLPIKAAWRQSLQRGIKSGADTFGWALLGLLVTFVMLVKFV